MVNNRLKNARGSLWRVCLLVAAVVASGWVGLVAVAPTVAAQGQRKAAMDAARKTAAPEKRTQPTAGQAATKPESGQAESGKRDPFLIPPPPQKGDLAGMGPDETGPLPPGKKGLVVGQLMLHGIVRQETNNTMIAVVANSSNRAYFLRENDEVYNGVVNKITPDSVYFTENFRDLNGQMNSRQVVKRLGSGPGENR